MPNFSDIQAAQQRLQPFITQTPVLSSQLLDNWLGANVLFKAECLQRSGSFKVRGAINTLAKLAENQQLPKRIVANSSGNHAQAIALAGRLFNLPVTVFSTESISAVKAAATRSYGAELRLYPSRPEADAAAMEAATAPDCLWIPPFDHPDIIAGQGTLLADTYQQTGEVDAVFMPCGGGGLASGSLIASRALMPDASVIAAEPLAANDAAESLRQGRIIALDGPPVTLADGAATPSVGQHTFGFLQQLDGFVEVDETRIAYWTQWLQHLLKIHVEPTCAMTMQAVQQWASGEGRGKRALVLLSGGNIDNQKMQQIWQDDHLLTPPG